MAIEEKEYPESVRARRGMYIYNQEHAIKEIIDNGLDEIISGYGNNIKLCVKDNLITVSDDGRGMPVDLYSNQKKHPGLTETEVAYTVLHAGGKFNDNNTEYVKGKTGGMNGVGAAVVNALSEKLILTIKKNSKKYQVVFEKGIITEHLHVIEEGLDENDTGTIVSFVFDESVWNGMKFVPSKVDKTMQQMSFINPGVNFHVDIDTAEFKNKAIYNAKGNEDYCNYLTQNKEIISNNINIEYEDDYIIINSCFKYVDSYNSMISPFCNNIYTDLGGDHLSGFRAGIYDGIKKYFSDYIKSKEKIESQDTMGGIYGYISIRVDNPDIEGQGKNKIKNMPKVRKTVKEVVSEKLLSYLDSNPDHAKIIVDKVLKAKKIREKTKKLLESEKKKSTIGASEKLADCLTKDISRREIFFVEGDSAGGSAKQGRDKEYQAILPVTGKIQNVLKSNAVDLFSSPKLKSIVGSLGITENSNDLKYDKIIIMTDADYDGYHIRILYFTLFYRYYKELIEQGHLYVAEPPLYKIVQNKKTIYLKDDIELQDYKEKNKNIKYSIQRLKGLGEMNPEQLWDSTMNPETRNLYQITIEDAEKADQTIDILMGKNVLPRREFIKMHSSDAILDI